MLPELRKIVTFDEDIHSEGGRASDSVLRMIGVAVVVANPAGGAWVCRRLATQNSMYGTGSGQAAE